MKIISLTETPPYDDEKNFEKYIGLGGEIDAQINIPELVGEKNLCPHQYFIYLNVQIFIDICKNNNIKDENIVVNEIGNDFKYSRTQIKNK